MARKSEESDGIAEKSDDSSRYKKIGSWLLNPLSSKGRGHALLQEQALDRVSRDENIARALFDLIGQAGHGLVDIHWREVSSILRRFVVSKSHLEFEGLNPHQRAIVNSMQEGATQQEAANAPFLIPRQREAEGNAPQSIDITAAEKAVTIDLTEDSHNPT